MSLSGENWFLFSKKLFSQGTVYIYICFCFSFTLCLVYLPPLVFCRWTASITGEVTTKQTPIPQLPLQETSFRSVILLLNLPANDLLKTVSVVSIKSFCGQLCLFFTKNSSLSNNTNTNRWGWRSLIDSFKNEILRLPVEQHKRW